MADVIIEVGDESFAARLTDERSPETVRLILDALPIESVARQWGDEIYFEIPVEAGLENGLDRVSKGDLGYWPEGRCFCIFYGPTPMSRSADEIVPASAVNLVVRIENPEALKAHSAGEAVLIRRPE
jgi:hypothetical protein